MDNDLKEEQAAPDLPEPPPIRIVEDDGFGFEIALLPLAVAFFLFVLFFK